MLVYVKKSYNTNRNKYIINLILKYFLKYIYSTNSWTWFLMYWYGGNKVRLNNKYRKFLFNYKHKILSKDKKPKVLRKKITYSLEYYSLKNYTNTISYFIPKDLIVYLKTIYKLNAFLNIFIKIFFCWNWFWFYNNQIQTSFNFFKIYKYRLLSREFLLIK